MKEWDRYMSDFVPEDMITMDIPYQEGEVPLLITIDFLRGCVWALVSVCSRCLFRLHGWRGAPSYRLFHFGSKQEDRVQQEKEGRRSVWVDLRHPRHLLLYFLKPKSKTRVYIFSTRELNLWHLHSTLWEMMRKALKLHPHWAASLSQVEMRRRLWRREK